MSMETPPNIPVDGYDSTTRLTAEELIAVRRAGGLNPALLLTQRDIGRRVELPRGHFANMVNRIETINPTNTPHFKTEQ